VFFWGWDVSSGKLSFPTKGLPAQGPRFPRETFPRAGGFLFLGKGGASEGVLQGKSFLKGSVYCLRLGLGVSSGSSLFLMGVSSLPDFSFRGSFRVPQSVPHWNFGIEGEGSSFLLGGGPHFSGRIFLQVPLSRFSCPNHIFEILCLLAKGGSVWVLFLGSSVTKGFWPFPRFFGLGVFQRVFPQPLSFFRGGKISSELVLRRGPLGNPDFVEGKNSVVFPAFSSLGAVNAEHFSKFRFLWGPGPPNLVLPFWFPPR